MIGGFRFRCGWRVSGGNGRCKIAEGFRKCRVLGRKRADGLCLFGNERGLGTEHFHDDPAKLALGHLHGKGLLVDPAPQLPGNCFLTGEVPGLPRPGLCTIPMDSPQGVTGGLNYCCVVIGLEIVSRTPYAGCQA